MSSYGNNNVVKTIFETAQRQEKQRKAASNPNNIYRRGRVNRVFTNSVDLSKVILNQAKFKKISAGFAPGIIEFYPANEMTSRERTELAQPLDTHFTPAIAHNDMIEYTTILCGLVDKFLAIAAGIINIPVINNNPTILIEIAIIAAIKIVNIAFAKSGFKPSASASS